jgi:hypothetical protein
MHVDVKASPVSRLRYNTTTRLALWCQYAFNLGVGTSFARLRLRMGADLHAVLYVDVRGLTIPGRQSSLVIVSYDSSRVLMRIGWPLGVLK